MENGNSNHELSSDELIIEDLNLNIKKKIED